MLYIKSQATRALPSMFVSQIVIIMEMRDAVERSRAGEAAGRVWSIFTCITFKGFSWCFIVIKSWWSVVKDIKFTFSR